MLSAYRVVASSNQRWLVACPSAQLKVLVFPCHAATESTNFAVEKSGGVPGCISHELWFSPRGSFSSIQRYFSLGRLIADCLVSLSGSVPLSPPAPA